MFSNLLDPAAEAEEALTSWGVQVYVSVSPSMDKVGAVPTGGVVDDRPSWRCTCA
jgi:hypothetical protein